MSLGHYLALSVLGIVSLLRDVEARALSSIVGTQKLELIHNRAVAEARLDLVDAYDTSQAKTESEHSLESQNKSNKDPDFVKLDEAAKEDFRRKCEVVATVSDDKFLPVKPLDRFCETTDAAMECRLKVGMRLKETHARDGDMGRFCMAVYDWFQSKYGMECPNQCRKLQCKSSCLWLEAKKDSNEEGKQIKEEMVKAEQELKYIKELGKTIEAKKSEEAKINFTISMIKVKIGRANKTLAEKDADSKMLKAKKDKVDKSIEKLKQAIAGATDKLIKGEDAIMKQQFELEKNKQTLQAMARSTKRLLDKAEIAKKEEQSLSSEKDKVDDEIKKIQAKRDAIAKQIAADKQEAVKQGKELTDKLAALKKAWAELDQYKVSALQVLHGDVVKQENGKVSARPPPRSEWEAEYLKKINGNYKTKPKSTVENVANIKELVTNQFKRAAEADRILVDLEDKIKDATQEISQLNSTANRLGTNSADLGKKAAAAKKDGDAFLKQARADEGKMKTFKNTTIDAAMKNLTTAKSVHAKDKAAKEKAERTLTFMEDLQEEQVSKLRNAMGALTQADMALNHQLQQLKDTEAALANAQKEREELEKEEKAKKIALQTEEGNLMKRIQAHKTRSRELFVKRPENVRQHGLKP